MDNKIKKNGLLKNKKGDATTAITFSFWMFVLAVSIMALMFAMVQVLPLLADSILGDDPATLSAINDVIVYHTIALPSTYFILFFGLLAGVLISSFFVRTHLVFIVIYILAGLISLIVAVVLGNAWGDLTSIDTFSDLINTYSLLGVMDLMINNIVIIILSVFILSIIIIFAKPGGGSLQGGDTPF